MGVEGLNKFSQTHFPKAFRVHRQQATDHLYIDLNEILHNGKPPPTPQHHHTTPQVPVLLCALSQSVDNMLTVLGLCLGWCTIALRKASTKERFIQNVFRDLDRVIRQVRPRKTVMLSVDGPAPAAKILTQRRRRIAAARRRLQPAATLSGNAKPESSGVSAKKLSSLALTPGTSFMQELDSALEYYAASRLVFNKKLADVQIIISGSTVRTDDFPSGCGTQSYISHILSA